MLICCAPKLSDVGEITNEGGGVTVTLTGAEVVRLPAASRAVAVSV